MSAVVPVTLGKAFWLGYLPCGEGTVLILDLELHNLNPDFLNFSFHPPNYLLLPMLRPARPKAGRGHSLIRTRLCIRLLMSPILI